MSQQDTFEEFGWKTERSAFVQALPKIFGKVLGTAVVFIGLFVSLLSVLATLF